jgi:ergothioneine biosynthesis protein EgtB
MLLFGKVSKSQNNSLRITGEPNMPSTLIDAFVNTRQFTERLTQPLSAEDCMVQSMDDASPTRWHLAHTTWFFETFVLEVETDYTVFDQDFKYLFNSYYNSIGEQFPRSHRGLISRPGLERIRKYRSYVDDEIFKRFQRSDYAERYHHLLQIGLQHEQQHQELILTDIKHVLSCNPTYPKYQDVAFGSQVPCSSGGFLKIDAGVYEIGFAGDGFAFDNESPKHSVFLHACSIAKSLVTCGEYLQFMDAGGYTQPEHWLSLGWACVNQNRWNSPMYWQQVDGRWMQFTLAGLVPLVLDEPVTHVSFFEADAFARWRGMRLPTEFEWEVAAMQTAHGGSGDAIFVDRLLDAELAIHPTQSPSGMCGSVWQWTSSSYLGYPGYRPPAGAVGEYNGKFMCDQHVLRGGSVATHSTHIRATYRNFFPASTRWQFSGIRLAD